MISQSRFQPSAESVLCGLWCTTNRQSRIARRWSWMRLPKLTESSSVVDRRSHAAQLSYRCVSHSHRRGSRCARDDICWLAENGCQTLSRNSDWTSPKSRACSFVASMVTHEACGFWLTWISWPSSPHSGTIVGMIQTVSGHSSRVNPTPVWGEGSLVWLISPATYLGYGVP